ncbi:hypothetical protein EMPS_07456 [Entomortierella parvispora]|uniref:Integrase catalytic domain-containing protein n=1 Tax=Entomortierella parvispora TaxID=205924 RepID=A0A9P3LYG6_9FUNG|nr:hypothetical protein EMPS_07456 [Entomortierella parvispora]
MTLRSSDSISADRSPAASTSSMESSVPDMRLEGEIPGHLKNTPEVFVATDREKWLMESTLSRMESMLLNVLKRTELAAANRHPEYAQTADPGPIPEPTPSLPTTQPTSHFSTPYRPSNFADGRSRERLERPWSRDERPHDQYRTPPNDFHGKKEPRVCSAGKFNPKKHKAEVWLHQYQLWAGTQFTNMNPHTAASRTIESFGASMGTDETQAWFVYFLENNREVRPEGLYEDFRNTFMSVRDQLLSGSLAQILNEQYQQATRQGLGVYDEAGVRKAYLKNLFLPDIAKEVHHQNKLEDMMEEAHKCSRKMYELYLVRHNEETDDTDDESESSDDDDDKNPTAKDKQKKKDPLDDRGKSESKAVGSPSVKRDTKSFTSAKNNSTQKNLASKDDIEAVTQELDRLKILIKEVSVLVATRPTTRNPTSSLPYAKAPPPRGVPRPNAATQVLKRPPAMTTRVGPSAMSHVKALQHAAAKARSMDVDPPPRREMMTAVEIPIKPKESVPSSIEGPSAAENLARLERTIAAQDAIKATKGIERDGRDEMEADDSDGGLRRMMVPPKESRKACSGYTNWSTAITTLHVQGFKVTIDGRARTLPIVSRVDNQDDTSESEAELSEDTSEDSGTDNEASSTSEKEDGDEGYALLIRNIQEGRVERTTVEQLKQDDAKGDIVNCWFLQAVFPEPPIPDGRQPVSCLSVVDASHPSPSAEISSIFDASPIMVNDSYGFHLEAPRCRDRLTNTPVMLLPGLEERSVYVGDIPEVHDNLSEIRRIFQKHEECFPKEGEMSRTLNADMLEAPASFHLKPGSKFPRAYNKKYSPGQITTLCEYRDQMVKAGKMRRSSSPASCNPLLIQKKDNSYRVCVNFIPVNKLIAPMAWPLPDPITEIYKLQGCEFLSFWDCKDGYLQSPIAEDSRFLTAVAFPDGLYEYNVLPMGLIDSMQWYTRHMGEVFSTIKERLGNFVDDMATGDGTFHLHFRTVEEVLARMDMFNGSFSGKKSAFFVKQREFLGRIGQNYEHATQVFVAQGRLFKRTPGGMPRQYVPPGEVSRVLERAHGSTIVGHLGVVSTYTLIAEGYFWPGMYKDVKEHLSSCDACQRYQARDPTRYRFHRIPPPRTIFETVGLDAVGPLPMSNGKRFVLNMVDYLSGWVVSVALSSLAGNLVLRTVEKHWAMQYGHPKRIITDNGSSLSAGVFKAWCIKHMIDLDPASAYHAQTNGMVERYNGFMVRRPYHPARWITRECVGYHSGSCYLDLEDPDQTDPGGFTVRDPFWATSPPSLGYRS